MELVIVQQNVCGRDISESDYKALLDEIKAVNADIVFLTEFCYQRMYDTTKEIFEGYDFIKPLAMTEADEKNETIYAACILAVKQDKVTINKQSKLDGMLTLRYICIDLKIDSTEDLKALLMYVPQTYNSSDKRRIKKKAEMLRSASRYVAENCKEYLFVGGDMNSDVDRKTTTCINDFEQIYNKMIDTEYERKPTWNDKRLDYALVSDRLILNNSAKTFPAETKSDHIGLRTVFSSKN